MFAHQRPALLPGPVPVSVPDHLPAPSAICASCPLLCPCLALSAGPWAHSPLPLQPLALEAVVAQHGALQGS